MTREEAKNFMIDKDVKSNGRHKWGYHITFRNWFDELLNKIYDDFENRICKNCKHFNSKDNICKLPEITMLVKETFGCNRFELKSTDKINE